MTSTELYHIQTVIQDTPFSPQDDKNKEQSIDQEHENFCHLKQILSHDPINWKAFLDVDREFDTLLRCSESFESTFSWILAHYPPKYVIHDLLHRYQSQLFSDQEKMKRILNIALGHNSYDVVYFIAKNYPFLMNQRLDNKNSGDLPLHRVRDVDIASIVIQCYPAAVNVQNFALELPLHCAIEHFSHPDHVRILIEAGLANNVGGKEGCGGVLVQNNMGKTPFDVLNHQFSTGIDLATLGNPVYEIEKRMWKNLIAMIHAIRGAKDLLILHEIINLKCPSQAVRLAQIMLPKELSRADDMGRYPLHLASSQKNYCKVVLEHLVIGFPEVAHLSDCSGKYPLHYCTLGGRSFAEGTEAIYNAEPIIATVSDDDGYLPFMYAASTCCSIDTIYRLLRECPGII